MRVIARVPPRANLTRTVSRSAPSRPPRRHSNQAQAGGRHRRDPQRHPVHHRLLPGPDRPGLGGVALDHDLVVAGDHRDGAGAVGTPLPEEGEGLLQPVGAGALHRGVQALGVGRPGREEPPAAGAGAGRAGVGGKRSRQQTTGFGRRAEAVNAIDVGPAVGELPTPWNLHHTAGVEAPTERAGVGTRMNNRYLGWY
jgi:hypothetical protein